MASLNKPRSPIHTHEGAVASHTGPLDQLKRTVMACMLWEDTFYENGQSVADRIKTLVAQCDMHDVATVARDARSLMHLRHVPLLIVRELARHPKLSLYPGLVAGVLTDVIQRADELTEFVSIYWKDGKQPLSKQVKVGLANAFPKFSMYQLSKYNRKKEVKLKDVMFLCHPTPNTTAQGLFWKALANDELTPPDTWEVGLSAGKDKKDTFTRLITEGKLGYMALMRNLRKMTEVGVDDKLIRQALVGGAEKSKALPFRYIAAVKHAPQFVPELDTAMQNACERMTPLPGHTVLLVDVSGSMMAPLSGKSDMDRMDAAGGLAILLSGICEQLRIFTFSNQLKEVPPYKGMALADTLRRSQPNHGTYLKQAIAGVVKVVREADRTIVITDEQVYDSANPGASLGKGYIMNVASYRNGVGYGQWTHIHGFSEQCVNFIMALEEADDGTS